MMAFIETVFFTKEKVFKKWECVITWSPSGHNYLLSQSGNGLLGGVIQIGSAENGL